MTYHTPTELGQALSKYKKIFWVIVTLSAVLNVLQLSGSLYLLTVYDSVLPSQSLPTLFSLFAMVGLAYVFQGIFELMRGRILAETGASLDLAISLRVQSAMSDSVLKGERTPGDGLGAMRDFDQIRNFLSSSGPAALIDLPWVLFFIAVLSLLHFWLGITALFGAIVLALLTLATDRATRIPTTRVSEALSYRNEIADSNLRHIEVLSSMGMRARMDERWYSINRVYTAAQQQLAQTVGTLSGVSRIFRMFLQSGILTVGALLVINGKASVGVIIASAILSGRALAPVDQAIANWRGFASARLGWQKLNELLSQNPPVRKAAVDLDSPANELSVEHIFAGPPSISKPTLFDITFTLQAGDALGIIGPSAAGKTSLVRTIIGVWPLVRGAVRLDNAELKQWDRRHLGRFIGYLPQSVELLCGTIAENIARFDPESTSISVINAAKAAGVHDMIVELPEGYDTEIGSEGFMLSAGQRQRIGLARALYCDPFLVVLDEPNSNLDARGEEALGEAISAVRRRKGIVIIIAHRPSIVARTNKILYLVDGKLRAFGPRDEILVRIQKQPANVAGVKQSFARAQ